MEFMKIIPKIFEFGFKISIPALLTFIFFTFVVGSPAHSTTTSRCGNFLSNQLYGPTDFPQSQAWCNCTGRESIYPTFATTMVDQALNSFSSEMKPSDIISLLARLRNELARRMDPFSDEGRTGDFGHLRWKNPHNKNGRRVATMAGYSELARLDDGDDSFFSNSELSKLILERFREIVKTHGTVSLDTETRQPLKDEYSDSRRWNFQRRNYIQTNTGSLSGSELYILNIEKLYFSDVERAKEKMPIQLLVVFHPRANESFALMNYVFEISSRVIESKNHVDFMRVLFGIMNATPFHRGSALIAKVYSMALYAYVFGKPMPAMPDGFDVLTMLEPDFESFDERYRSTFFHP